MNQPMNQVIPKHVNTTNEAAQKGRQALIERVEKTLAELKSPDHDIVALFMVTLDYKNSVIVDGKPEAECNQVSFVHSHPKFADMLLDAASSTLLEAIKAVTIVQLPSLLSILEGLESADEGKSDG